MLSAATIDSIRSEARQFDLARALIKLVIFPIAAVAWVAANLWRVVALVVGFVVISWKTGWRAARGEHAA